MSVSQKHAVGGAVGNASPVADSAEVDSSCCGESGIAWFSKLVVAATFVLISIGALVTSHHAGMAVPDWPLSFNSLNPDGWWNQLPVRLEHGHRLFAMVVGLLTGVLTAWVWQSWRALLAAVIASAAIPPIAARMGAPNAVIMHLAIWPAAVVFVATVLIHARGRELRVGRLARMLSLAAFFCVCIQATLGGLRVTQETAGALDAAMALRIIHGVFGQTFLCVNVAVAALLSARWSRIYEGATITSGVRTLAWVSVAAIYLQLIVGAAMRHMGAGLAIPTFPAASPTGSWLPAIHSAYVDINFTHTRVGAVIVTILLLLTAFRTLRTGGIDLRLSRPAWGLVALVLIQFTLGVLVIWHTKPRSLTTLHVVNGAALLATSLLLAMRTSRATRTAPDANPAKP